MTWLRPAHALGDACRQSTCINTHKSVTDYLGAGRGSISPWSDGIGNDFDVHHSLCSGCGRCKQRQVKTSQCACTCSKTQTADWLVPEATADAMMCCSSSPSVYVMFVCGMCAYLGVKLVMAEWLVLARALAIVLSHECHSASSKRSFAHTDTHTQNPYRLMFVFTHLAIFRLTAINDCFGINTPVVSTPNP